MTARRPSRREQDAFWRLAILCVAFGMLVIAFAVVFWAVTGRQSSLILGAGGMMIGTGFGVDRIADPLSQFLRRTEEYEPPPPELHEREREGETE